MDFFKAVRIAQVNKHLIGQKRKGETIDDIIIVPTNAKSRSKFDDLYKQTLNAQISIAHFMNEDVEVLIVCNKRLIPQGFMGFESIYNLPDEYEVVTDL